jgi:hypothetical protein
MNWTKIEGLHVAAGGEEYITIGNFKSDANSNITMVNPNANWCWLVSYSGYYFVDSVYAYPVENVGISDQEVDNKMEIYPNPTENEFYVELANLPDFGEITLSDIQGKTIVTQTISSLQSRISTEALPAGIYYVTVSDKQHTWKRKIQKR